MDKVELRALPPSQYSRHADRGSWAILEALAGGAASPARGTRCTAALSPIRALRYEHPGSGARAEAPRRGPRFTGAPGRVP